jgi:hypothetical protein
VDGHLIAMLACRIITHQLGRLVRIGVASHQLFAVETNVWIARINFFFFFLRGARINFNGDRSANLDLLQGL